jgi:hypothetical protein|tara:strand:- start:61 stop:585 length:525 start_codon:yes stop_codon:yes gene_type:complete
MKKRGQVWISAVLYTALGVIIITIILSAGLPLINKIRDRNLVTQTKELLHSLDENIRVVANEGPGSKRFISPLNIEGGELIIDEFDDRLHWSLKTNNKLAEPNIVFDEGTLKLFLNKTVVKDEFIVNLEVGYDSIVDLKLNSEFENPFLGEYSMSIEHDGTYTDSKPVIIISIS